jgi:hypothetical protein
LAGVRLVGFRTGALRVVLGRDEVVRERDDVPVRVAMPLR